ncbi:L,D-transpeptidase [Cognatishimia sp. WU-CL00825]|uniref:L,D-transpeptidase n=1 Tax=Cognatishimia sp. WU-CL00825 TaxID=3127658 RepID=UPI00310C74C8
MTDSRTPGFGRRAFLASGAAFIGAPALAQNVNDTSTTEVENEITEVVRRNTSSFRSMRWEPHFDNLKNGAILVDLTSRALHYWAEDGVTYKLYPSSVPLTEDLTRRGRTKVVRKVEGPSWRPTPAMRKRNPEWPEYVGPGPDNPLGTHALYLSWTYYRIHGTHDTRKIGRRSSNGCVGLYNEHIAELFEMAKVGTQVLLI